MKEVSARCRVSHRIQEHNLGAYLAYNGSLAAIEFLNLYTRVDQDLRESSGLWQAIATQLQDPAKAYLFAIYYRPSGTKLCVMHYTTGLFKVSM